MAMCLSLFWTPAALGVKHERVAGPLRWNHFTKPYPRTISNPSLQYAFEDFGIRQVAQLLGNQYDVEKYTNRSLVRSPKV